MDTHTYMNVCMHMIYTHTNMKFEGSPLSSNLLDAIFQTPNFLHVVIYSLLSSSRDAYFVSPVHCNNLVTNERQDMVAS